MALLGLALVAVVAGPALMLPLALVLPARLWGVTARGGDSCTTLHDIVAVTGGGLGRKCPVIKVWLDSVAAARLAERLSSKGGIMGEDGKEEDSDKEDAATATLRMCRSAACETCSKLFGAHGECLCRLLRTDPSGSGCPLLSVCCCSVAVVALRVDRLESDGVPKPKE
jgi:hypothetical protein